MNLFLQLCRKHLPDPVGLDGVVTDVELLPELGPVALGVRVQLAAAHLQRLRPHQRGVVSHQDAGNHAEKNGDNNGAVKKCDVMFCILRVA